MNESKPVQVGVSSPLPWTLTFDGDDYVLTDADGDLVYRGTDPGAVTDLYRAVRPDSPDLTRVSDAELLVEVGRRMRDGGHS